MKNILLISFVIISSVCFGQAKKDSTTKKQTVEKIDSTTIVINQLALFAYDKVSAKDYDMLGQLVLAFLKSKEFTKPKSK